MAMGTAFIRITPAAQRAIKRLSNQQQRPMNRVIDDAICVYDAAGSPILDPRRPVPASLIRDTPAEAPSSDGAPSQDPQNGAAAAPSPAPSSHPHGLTKH